jgi:hypothetical protein
MIYFQSLDFDPLPTIPEGTHPPASLITIPGVATITRYFIAFGVAL